MNWLVGIPLVIRVACVALAGALAGSMVNAGVYALGMAIRPYSPWSRLHPKDTFFGWQDRLPVWGWWRLRRRSGDFGAYFWVRPLVVEVLSGLIFAGLYWWDTHGRVAAWGAPLAANLLAPWLHAQFMAHALLVWLLLLASFLDLDEWIIPDSITVPGTLAGLALVTLAPWCLLASGQVAAGAAIPAPLYLSSPGPWPAALVGGTFSLGVGLACYLGWCLALLPRLWLPRRGLAKAVRMFVAYIARSGATVWVGALAAAGSVAILLVWRWGGEHWKGLLTGLVGLAASGALVWWVRVVGRWTLDREAMGFGDVTLMAMIGAFLGWQAGVLVFFLSPLAALGVGIVRLILNRGKALPFGPFLCMGALAAIVRWDPLWGWLGPMFAIPWLVPAALGICLLLMAPLLYLVGRIVSAFEKLCRRTSARAELYSSSFGSSSVTAAVPGCASGPSGSAVK